MDYAGSTPCGFEDYRRLVAYSPWENPSVRRNVFFGGTTGLIYSVNVPDNEVYEGVIVRTPWSQVFQKFAKNVTMPVRMAQISDGTSNTMVVGEKFLRPDLYEGGSVSDDKGWTDGWDPDSMRTTCYQPLQDTLSGPDNVYGPSVDVVNFGSAHSGGFNAVFADGAVHSISYDIEPEIFDGMGNRDDGGIIGTW